MANKELTFCTSDKLKADSLELYDSRVTESVVKEFIQIDERLIAMRVIIAAVKKRLDNRWDGYASDEFIKQFDSLWHQVNDFGETFTSVKNLLCDVNTAFASTDKALADEWKKKEGQSGGGGGGKFDAYDISGATRPGEATEANLSAEALTNKDDLKSTMENRQDALLGGTPGSSRGNTTSTMGAAQDAILDAPGKAGTKGVAGSKLPDRQDAVLDATLLPPKGMLSSTMEGRADAVLPLNAWLSQTAFTEVANMLNLDYQPSMAYAQLLIEQYGKREVGVTIMEVLGQDPTAPILGDYMSGSNQFREVKNALMSAQVSSTLIACAMQGLDANASALQVGAVILNELTGGKQLLSPDAFRETADAIGSRVLRLISQQEGKPAGTVSLVNANDEAWRNGAVEAEIRQGLQESLDRIERRTQQLNAIHAETMANSQTSSLVLNQILQGTKDEMLPGRPTMPVQTGAKAFSEALQAEQVAAQLTDYENQVNAIQSLRTVLGTSSVPAGNWAAAVPSCGTQVIGNRELIMEAVESKGNVVQDVIAKYRDNAALLAAR